MQFSKLHISKIVLFSSLEIIRNIIILCTCLQSIRIWPVDSAHSVNVTITEAKCVGNTAHTGNILFDNVACC